MVAIGGPNDSCTYGSGLFRMVSLNLPSDGAFRLANLDLVFHSTCLFKTNIFFQPNLCSNLRKTHLVN